MIYKLKLIEIQQHKRCIIKKLQRAYSLISHVHVRIIVSTEPIYLSLSLDSSPSLFSRCSSFFFFTLHLLSLTALKVSVNG